MRTLSLLLGITAAAISSEMAGWYAKTHFPGYAAATVFFGLFCVFCFIAASDEGRKQ